MKRLIIQKSILGLTGLTLMALCSGAVQAQVKDPEQARHYAYCMQLAAEDPNQALSESMSWRDLGGGLAADHCLASALVTLTHYDEAAARLETLANHEKIQPHLRPDLFAQAGRSWMQNGNAARAEANFSAAIELSPNRAVYMVDRATAKAALKDYAGAVDDLSAAINIDSNYADAFVFRASALRLMGRDADALRDAKSALSIDPDHLEGLLERGILFKDLGDKQKARADWMAILRLAPDSPAADAARDYIHNLDVNIEAD